ncbi:hypothetical protein XA68_17709 [Ophiocordyceps unilateralis]|uniref:Srp40 C-terminal domain-containing protein n=1 Tax=Ophiocordyceps unilateralis TaxID=268505 RepID=A0A2A9PK56_OPHUN|nr:hypothetical protein XA68_17709 [Ophiocordyceps unilateralis]
MGKEAAKKGRGQDDETPAEDLLDMVDRFLALHSFSEAREAFRKQRKQQGGAGSGKSRGGDGQSLCGLYRFWEAARCKASSDVQADMDEESSAESHGDSHDDSDSDSDNDSDSDSGESEEDGHPQVPRPGPVTSALKRKAPASSSSDSDLSSSEISDSDSDSGSSSDSDSDSAVMPPSKKQKTAVPDADSSSASDSSSSASQSNSGDETKREAMAQEAARVLLPQSAGTSSVSSSDTSSDDSDSDSSSGSDSDSLSSSGSDSEPSSQDAKLKPEPEPKPKPKVKSAKKKSSDSSETLGPRSPGPKTSTANPPLPPDPVKSGSKARNKQVDARFSRIPKDIQVDAKFASNDYVAMDYSRRAYEDLVVTKGKGFTREKNKKKKGSFRGGAIDIHEKKGIYFDDD